LLKKSEHSSYNTKEDLERQAYTLFDLASSQDGYSLYTKAELIKKGYGGLAPNLTLAIQTYDKLIEGADNGWYVYEERFPALISKYALILR
jgi:hypothetical protein